MPLHNIEFHLKRLSGGAVFFAAALLASAARGADGAGGPPALRELRLQAVETGATMVPAPPARGKAAGRDLWGMALTGSAAPGVGDSGLFAIREAAQSQVALISSGEESLRLRLETLRKAKRSIRIQALIFTSDEAGRAVAELLKEKKRLGLDVRVIVDAFSNIMTSKSRLDLATQWMYYDLKRAGIEVEGYEALFLHWVNEVSLSDPRQPDKRFHDKMWIIDSEDPKAAVAIVGGMNIANEYFRTGSDAGHRWRDQDFLLKGAVVSDVVAAFDRNYGDQKRIKRRRPGLLNTDTAWSVWRRHVVGVLGAIDPSVEVDAVAQANVERVAAGAGRVDAVAAKVRFIQSRPRYGETYISQAYEHLFAAAGSELLVVNAYFIPGDGILGALKDAARRGVAVTIVTNSAESNDLPEMAYASRYLYQELLSVNADVITRRNGGSLRIAEWQGQRFGEGTLHAKFAVADRKFVLGGSYNLDARSETLNSETAVLFENETLASELAARVIAEDLPKCGIITPGQALRFHDPQRPPDKLKLLIWNGLKGEL